MKKVNLDSVNHQNKISIFIGENGDGKSSALHQIAEFHISKGTNVIAISNCLHDKFMPTSKKLHYTSAKYGSTTYNEVLCGLLRKMDVECIAPLSRTLQYCGYLNKVGINISWNKKINTNHIDENLIPLYKATKNNAIFWVTLDNTLPNQLHTPLIQNFFKEYNELKKNNTVKDVNFNLQKESNETILFNEISSGEASQISTLSFISQHISKASIVLIDEPENSLHPKWQREYINNLINNFSYYDASFFLSTHSPFIINKSSSVYEIRGFKVFRKEVDINNIEELLWNYFDIITPENEFLSRHLTDILERYRRNVASQQQALDELKIIKRSCLDNIQKNVINDLCSMIQNREIY